MFLTKAEKETGHKKAIEAAIGTDSDLLLPLLLGAGFEELVAGKPPREKPSFLDGAKARWGLPQAANRK